jgi:hypothetical protein
MFVDALSGYRGREIACPDRESACAVRVLAEAVRVLV